MANEVMMTLGQFQFGVTTAAYQEFTRVTEYRWPSQDRILQDPALQFAGRGSDTVKLPGVIYPYFKGGLGQMDTLRGMADQGQPLQLLNGQGKVLGLWVIERVEEKQTVFAHAGTPRKQEFTLDLRYFGSDSASKAKQGGGISVLGDVGKKLSLPALPMLSSLSTSTSSQFGGFAASLNSSMTTIKGMAANIGSGVNSILAPVSSAIETANNLKQSAADAKRMLGSIPTTLSGIKSATGLRNGAATAVNNLTAAATMLQKQTKALTDMQSVPREAVAAVRTAMLTANNMTVAATKIHNDTSKLLKDLGA